MLQFVESRGTHAGALRLSGDFGQTEVENLCLPAGADEDVCRLDVAMNDSLGVCSVQCVCDLDAQIQHGFNFEGLAGDFMLQRDAFEVLHGDEGLPTLIVNFVDGADVGVVQSRGSLGFALEAGQRLRISGHVVGKEFEGDETAEFQIFGFVDNAHPAPAELLDHAIVRDGLTNHQEQILRA